MEKTEVAAKRPEATNGVRDGFEAVKVDKNRWGIGLEKSDCEGEKSIGEGKAKG